MLMRPLSGLLHVRGLVSGQRIARAVVSMPIFLALVAVFALSAVASATASAAEPEFGRCKNEAGTFKDSNCTVGGGTAFKWVPLAEGEKVKFTSTSGEGFLETANGEKVTCTADTNVGETNGPKKDVVTVTFTGCTSSGFKCNSAGAAAGEIKTNKLLSEIGYINKAAKEVGLRLKPEGELFVEFECVGGIVKVKTKGAVIGKYTPVNEMNEKFVLNLKCVAGKKGVQEIEKFEGGLKETLASSKNGGAFEAACNNSGEDKITFTGNKLEVKA